MDVGTGFIAHATTTAEKILTNDRVESVALKRRPAEEKPIAFGSNYDCVLWFEGPTMKS
jgi:hypothetical protein